jgi:5-methylcytosine-specific restriction protein A
MRVCAQGGCDATTAKRYCVAHETSNSTIVQEREADKQRQQGSEQWRWFYRTKRWVRLAAMVLRRCPLCADPFKKGCTRASTDADHIIPVRHGGAIWSLGNLWGLCHACHSQKTMLEKAAYASGQPSQWQALGETEEGVKGVWG